MPLPVVTSKLVGARRSARYARAAKDARGGVKRDAGRQRTTFGQRRARQAAVGDGKGTGQADGEGGAGGTGGIAVLVNHGGRGKALCGCGARDAVAGNEKQIKITRRPRAAVCSAEKPSRGVVEQAVRQRSAFHNRRGRYTAAGHRERTRRPHHKLIGARTRDARTYREVLSV